jgi:hypothetical protein
VEEFIVEIERLPKNCDVTRWGRFTDVKDIKKEMLKHLEAHFEKWLNPQGSPGISPDDRLNAILKELHFVHDVRDSSEDFERSLDKA